MEKISDEMLEIIIRNFTNGGACRSYSEHEVMMATELLSLRQQVRAMKGVDNDALQQKLDKAKAFADRILLKKLYLIADGHEWIVDATTQLLKELEGDNHAD